MAVSVIQRGNVVGELTQEHEMKISKCTRPREQDFVKLWNACYGSYPDIPDDGDWWEVRDRRSSLPIAIVRSMRNTDHNLNVITHILVETKFWGEKSEIALTILTLLDQSIYGLEKETPLYERY